MEERYALARDNELPAEMMDAVSKTYVDIAEKITVRVLGMPTRRSFLRASHEG